MKLLSRNPDKPKKQLETTIGKIIYGFLLFAPLLSILVTCMYVTFNKNAYESYSGNETITNYEINYKYETNEVNSNNDLVIGNIYKVHFQDSSTFISYFTNINSYKRLFEIESIYNVTLSNNESFDIVDLDSINNNGIAFRLNNNMDKVELAFITGTSTYTVLNVADIEQNFYIVFKNIPSQIESNFYTIITSTEYNVIESVTSETIQATNLDNAFEYATTKVENSNLYNWAKNTGTYDVLHNTTTLLGIENTFIPMLMAYWLLISVIYFIYDIALMLIMVVHRKIHELQESI